jgi:hypothetical protein
MDMETWPKTYGHGVQSLKGASNPLPPAAAAHAALDPALTAAGWGSYRSQSSSRFCVDPDACMEGRQLQASNTIYPNKKPASLNWWAIIFLT